MTKKNLINLSLAVSYIIVTLIIGCIPQESLQWSADGSTGLLRIKGALYLVDGETGNLTQIADREVLPWPGISNGGKLIAYTRQFVCDDLSEALKLLPPGQTKMLKAHAQLMRDKVFNTGMVNGKFPLLGKPASGEEEKDTFNDNYRNWVIRYLCENADGALAGKIGTDVIKTGKESELKYFRLFTSPADDPNAKRLIATSIQPFYMIRFSPDAQFLGYLMQPFEPREPFEGGFDLYVASLKREQDVKAMLVDSPVAALYDWRSDGRAILYLKTENKQFAIGTLIEKTVVDAGNPDKSGLLATPADPKKETLLATHNCTGNAKQLAGCYTTPWMKAQYGHNGRVFFASGKLSLPSSKLDEERWSLFCYDSLTGTVAESIPQNAVDFASGDNIHLFELSPDGSRLLLPGKKTTLALYPLGSEPGSMQILINESEGFGGGLSSFAPAWKGNDHFSCLVSGKSHYLVADPNQPRSRKEIVILDAKGNLVQILSQSWPDELLDF
jgi:hypothetical protein